MPLQQKTLNISQCIHGYAPLEPETWIKLIENCDGMSASTREAAKGRVWGGGVPSSFGRSYARPQEISIF